MNKEPELILGTGSHTMEVFGLDENDEMQIVIRQAGVVAIHGMRMSDVIKLRRLLYEQLTKWQLQFRDDDESLNNFRHQ